LSPESNYSSTAAPRKSELRSFCSTSLKRGRLKRSTTQITTEKRIANAQFKWSDPKPEGYDSDRLRAGGGSVWSSGQGQQAMFRKQTGFRHRPLNSSSYNVE
jgi:hypothetical protein